MNSIGIGPPRSMEELRRRLEDSANTLRSLPLDKASRGPAGFRSNMPDVIREASEAYNYHRVGLARVVPSAADIGRMDEALGWVSRWWSHAELRASGLPLDAGIVAYEREALRVPFPKIRAGRVARYPGRMPPGGTSAPSLRLLVRRAMDLMFAGLGGDPRAQAPDPEDAPRIVVEVDFQPSERVALIRGQVTHLERHAGAVHRVVRARPRDG
jgi:hypothetical protein